MLLDLRISQHYYEVTNCKCNPFLIPKRDIKSSSIREIQEHRIELTNQTPPFSAIGEDFVKYSEIIRPILLTCMRNVVDVEVCRNAIGMFGDICRTLNRHVLKWCEEGVFDILMGTLRVSPFPPPFLPVVVFFF